jgi:uncharacterized protein (DUF2336 family)
MLNWVLGNRKSKKKRKKGKKKPSYEEAKDIAAKGNVKARADLAAHEDLEPEFLYFFATDKDPKVRRAVAENDGAPLQADLILAKDVDPKVREELAYKIGLLIPRLTEEESERLAEMTFDVLEILAKDQLPNIRTIIADEIKHLDNIPKRIIKRLAKDAEVAVAGPILEYSPMLNDEQLLQIVTSGLRGGALEAVAKRHKLAAQIAEAVVAQDEDGSIAALLNNKTANITEKLMEEIAIKAEDRPSLHLPLVDRGSLSQMTLRRVATFVSNALVERLISINALDRKLAKEIRLNVRERIEAGEATPAPEPDGADHAEALHKNGSLDGFAILDAIDDDDVVFLQRAFTILSELPEKQVKKMLESESAKGICALVWKSGLDADIAVSVQRRIGKIPPKSMIQEAPGGKFKMTEEELEWYVDYFA